MKSSVLVILCLTIPTCYSRRLDHNEPSPYTYGIDYLEEDDDSLQYKYWPDNHNTAISHSYRNPQSERSLDGIANRSPTSLQIGKFSKQAMAFGKEFAIQTGVVLSRMQKLFLSDTAEDKVEFKPEVGSNVTYSGTLFLWSGWVPLNIKMKLKDAKKQVRDIGLDITMELEIEELTIDYDFTLQYYADSNSDDEVLKGGLSISVQKQRLQATVVVRTQPNNCYEHCDYEFPENDKYKVTFNLDKNYVVKEIEQLGQKIINKHIKEYLLKAAMDKIKIKISSTWLKGVQALLAKNWDKVLCRY